MTTTTGTSDFRPVAGTSTSLRQQGWLLAASRSPAYLTLVLLGALALAGLAGSRDLATRLILAAYVTLAPVGVVWAMAAWLGESPSRRAYQWSLPVPRATHDLVRVAMGAVYLVGAYAGVVVVAWLAATLQGDAGRFATFGSTTWANIFVGPIIAYLVTMPLVLWSESRFVQVLLTLSFLPIFLAVFAPGTLASIESVARVLFETELGLSAALFGPLAAELTRPMAGTGGPVVVTSWWGAAALWLAIGGVLTALAATWRPDDVRRLWTRRGGAVAADVHS